MQEKFSVFTKKFLKPFGFRNFGPSGGSRTHGLMYPTHARYQLRYTRIEQIALYGILPGLSRWDSKAGMKLRRA